MPLSTAQRRWLSQMTPWAKYASAQTGWTPQLILAQWANETAWGTSYAYTHNHNLAGIGITTPHAMGETAKTLKGGVDAYINFIHSNSFYSGIAGAGNGLTNARKTQAQAQALAASPWSAGHYDNGAGLPLSLVTASIANVHGVAAGNPASGGPAPSATPTVATQTQDGLTQIRTLLQKAGLTSLVPWATNQVTTLASNGMSASTIASQLSINLMTTQTPTVRGVFDQKFPGMALRKKNGYNAISIAQYLTYENTAHQMARAAGVPEGFMTSTEIGQLIGNNVSTKELTERITQAYQVANTAAPETRNLLSQWYGIGPGTLAAYFLTPTKAEPMLVNAFTNNQVGKNGVSAVPSVTELEAGVTSAEIGTAAKASGFATIAKTQAVYLQQMGVSQSTARDTFKSLAHLTPLMHALPGTGEEKTSISENDLVNYGFFGANQPEVQQVEETRTAPFSGGGGYVMGAKGVLGAGFGTSQGQTGA